MAAEWRMQEFYWKLQAHNGNRGISAASNGRRPPARQNTRNTRRLAAAEFFWEPPRSKRAIGSRRPEARALLQGILLRFAPNRRIRRGKGRRLKKRRLAACKREKRAMETF